MKPKPIIKIDAPQNYERREETSSSSRLSVGVVMMSKKKSKEWLHVPVKPKPKPAIFQEKREEEVIEVEEISEDPVVIKGAKVNLLGMP